MCSEASSCNHIPETDRSRRWAPHPNRDASEYRRRSSVGVPKGLPLSRWVLFILQARSSSTSRDRGTRRQGGSVSGDQCAFSCHWSERILSLPRGTNFSSDDMCPNSTCHSWTWGVWCGRNLLAMEMILSIRAAVGNARAVTVFMVMPRYSTDRDGLSSDFLSLSIIPREWHSNKRSRTCSLALASEEARTSQSSRYLRRQTPREWAQADTVANTHVKTCGAVDKPKQRTLNWRTDPSETKRSHFREEWWMGIWK